ncbi:MAG: MBL fold metallo-hydrolase, partial [Methylocella sp.]
MNASPDLRSQIIATPCLHPRGAKRHSPIGAVFLTNADVDHLAGLLTLREQQRFALFGSRATLAQTGAGIFAVLNKDLVDRRVAELDVPADTGLGIWVTPFAVPGKFPLYLEDEDVAVGAESEATVGVELSDG